MITNLLSRCLWSLPGRFTVTDWIGPNLGLRSILFHDVSSEKSDFTRGLDVTMSPEVFESRVAFLSKNYTPVTLDQVLDAKNGIPLPERAVLVTFDDAYASVAQSAAPILAHYGVPAVFFVNPAFVDGLHLGLDNLICFAANTAGLEVLDRAAGVIAPGLAKFGGLNDVIGNFTSRLGALDIERFRAAIEDQLDRVPDEEARNMALYLTTEELRNLAEFGIEIGNHTLSHSWCRNLDVKGYNTELVYSRELLENLTGRQIRAFSVPYGGSVDLTEDVRSCLLASGHSVIFLVEGLPNGVNPRFDRLDRVSLKGAKDHETFIEMEVLPRLRKIRSALLRKPGLEN